MSQGTLRADSKSKRLIELMREFTSRMNGFMEDAEESAQAKNDDWGAALQSEKLLVLQDRLKHLSPAVDDLCRHVSQLIEHSQLDDVTRLEYRLRLADLEQSKSAAQRILKIGFATRMK